MIFFSLRLKAETWTIMLKYLRVDVCYVSESDPLWPNMLRQIHVYLYHQSPVSILVHKEVCTVCRSSANCIPFPLNNCFNHSRRFSKLPTARQPAVAESTTAWLATCCKVGAKDKCEENQLCLLIRKRDICHSSQDSYPKDKEGSATFHFLGICRSLFPADTVVSATYICNLAICCQHEFIYTAQVNTCVQYIYVRKHREIFWRWSDVLNSKNKKYSLGV